MKNWLCVMLAIFFSSSSVLAANHSEQPPKKQSTQSTIVYGGQDVASADETLWSNQSTFVG